MLGNALVQNPEKALSVPLLRQDLERLADEQRRNVTSLSAEIGRAYDVNKWVIGLMSTAVLGLAMTNIFGRKAS